MAWVLTRNLQKLTDEFNDLGPNRDKSSDGSVGDLSHQENTSGHNPDRTGNAEYKDGDSKDEVRAKDVDKSGPWRNGQTMEKAIQHLVQKGRSGNLETVIRYMIYNGRIWRSSTGWQTEAYNGPNPHDKHAHFSGQYTQAADENYSYDYGIANLGGDMPLEASDFNRIKSDVTAAVRDLFAEDATTIALQKARPWQYNGGGLPTFLPANTSALLYFANLCVQVNAITQALPQLMDDVDETTLSQNIVNLLLPSLLPPLTAAVADATDLTEEEAQEAAERAIRNVLGGIDGATPSS